MLTPAPLGSAELRTTPASSSGTKLEIRFGDEGAAARIELDTLPVSDLAGITTASVILPTSSFGNTAIQALTRIVETLPSLVEFTISLTDGLDTIGVSQVVALEQASRLRGVTFSVDFELDERADACAVLGRQSSSLTTLLDVSQALRPGGVSVRWLVPLLPALVHRLEFLFSFAGDEHIEPVLVPAWTLPSLKDHPQGELNADEKLFVWDFISYRLLAETLPAQRTGQYEALRDSFAAGRDIEKTVCPVAVLCGAETSKAIRWTLRYEQRAVFEPGGKTGTPNSPSNEIVAKAAELGGVLLEGSRGLAQWLGAKVADLRKGRRQLGGGSLPAVMVIGAYGGEHIGDAAILGGVLLRMHRRYGTTRAILMSQRPVHTRHLVRMLDSPVEVSVEEYQQANAAELLEQVDGVVFAGGPLMDLPKQLVKHLYTVALARRHNKPFVLEGIGAGPFLRWPSEWTARRLALMADSIAVRTSDDRQARIMRGLDPKTGRDPAFDYLETRTAELTRLPEADRQWIDRLLHGTSGRTVVGLNLRPLPVAFTVGAPASDRATYTEFVESRFEERLVEAFRQLHRTSPAPPCFVFFPMNAIQFGSSDLRCAYRLKRLLRDDVDFRIWEGDASIDGIVALLRRMDIAITMRFHATIYALANHRRVLGIDYRIGARDKVAALLDDHGQSENYRRIDELTTEWLFARLSEKARPSE